MFQIVRKKINILRISYHFCVDFSEHANYFVLKLYAYENSFSLSITSYDIYLVKHNKIEFVVWGLALKHLNRLTFLYKKPSRLNVVLRS